MSSVPHSVDLRRIAWLLCATAFMLTGNGLHFTLTPVRGHLEGFSDTDIGMIGACYYAGFALGCFIVPWLVRRLGHRYAFMTAVSLTIMVVLAQSISPTPAGWAVARALVGLCAATNFTVIEGWLHHVAHNSNRGRTVATYAVVNQLALVFGQFLLTVGDVSGPWLFVLSASILALTLIPVAATREAPPEIPERARLRIGKLWHASPVGFMGTVAVGLVNATFWVLGPIYATARGYGSDGVALFIALAVLGAAVLQWPLGRFSDRTDRRRVIAFATFVAIGADMLIVFGPSLGLSMDIATFGGAFLFGAFGFPIGGMAGAHMNDHVPRTDMTETAGAMLLMYGGIAVLGPLIGSAVMQTVGNDGLFYYFAAVHGLLVIFVLVRMRIRAAPRHHVPFEPALDPLEKT